jgi:hypothetical protein
MSQTQRVEVGNNNGKKQNKVSEKAADINFDQIQLQNSTSIAQNSVHISVLVGGLFFGRFFWPDWFIHQI